MMIIVMAITSPSPCAAWPSPQLKSAPGQKTGKKIVDPTTPTGRLRQQLRQRTAQGRENKEPATCRERKAVLEKGRDATDNVESQRKKAELFRTHCAGCPNCRR